MGTFTAIGDGFASSLPTGGNSTNLGLSPASSVIGGGSINSDTCVSDTAAGGIVTEGALIRGCEGALIRGGTNTPSTAAAAIHGSQRPTITTTYSARGAADAAACSEGVAFGAQPFGYDGRSHPGCPPARAGWMPPGWVGEASSKVTSAYQAQKGCRQLPHLGTSTKSALNTGCRVPTAAPLRLGRYRAADRPAAPPPAQA